MPYSVTWSSRTAVYSHVHNATSTCTALVLITTLLNAKQHTAVQLCQACNETLLVTFVTTV